MTKKYKEECRCNECRFRPTKVVHDGTLEVHAELESVRRQIDTPLDRIRPGERRLKIAAGGREVELREGAKLSEAQMLALWAVLGAKAS